MIKLRKCIFCRKKPEKAIVLIDQSEAYQYWCPRCKIYGRHSSDEDYAAYNWNVKPRYKYSRRDD